MTRGLDVKIVHEGEDYFKVEMDGKEYECAKGNVKDALVLMRLIKGIVKRGELVDANIRQQWKEGDDSIIP